MAESLQGLGGKLPFPVATRHCTKLSIICPLVSVNNRFPPNGNDSTPLSCKTSSSILGPTTPLLVNPFACAHSRRQSLPYLPESQKKKNRFVNSNQCFCSPRRKPKKTIRILASKKLNNNYYTNLQPLRPDKLRTKKLSAHFLVVTGLISFFPCIF